MMGLALRMALGSSGRSTPSFDTTTMFVTETGLWVSPSDSGTLLSDYRNGTAVSVGSPAGAVFDKSLLMAAGSELITNGDFASDTSGWTNTANATITWNAGRISVASSSGQHYAYQLLSGLTVGAMYRVRADFVSVSGGANKYVHVGTSAGGGQQVTMDNASVLTGTNTAYFIATQTSHYIAVGTFTAQTALFDNISVKRILGFSAIQATGAAQPVLRNPSGTLYTLDFDGTDDTYTVSSLIASANTGNKFSCFIGLKNIPAAAASLPIVGQYRTTSNQRSWRLVRVTNTQTITLAASSDGTAVSVSAPSAASTDTVLAVISDGTNMKFYQGLTLVDTVAIAPFGSTAPLDIASDGSTAFGDIEIAELVFVRGTALNDSDRIGQTRNVAAKTGVSV